MASLERARAGAVLRAEDYDRAKHFYHDVLGFDVEDAPGPTREGMVHTSTGSDFMIYERPGMPAPQNTTLALMVPNIEEAVNELRERGVRLEEYDMPEIGLKTVDGIAEIEGTKSAWFKDTEGNIISVSKMM